MGVTVHAVNADPVRGRQAGILPRVVTVRLVQVEHQRRHMRRGVVLDMTIGQRGRLRADQQPQRRIIGAVGTMGETFDKGSGLMRWFYHRTPRLLAVLGCLRSYMCYAFPVLREQPRTL